MIGIKSEEETKANLEDLLKKVASETKKFEISMLHVKSADLSHKCIYAECKKSAELSGLRNSLLSAYKNEIDDPTINNADFEPHLSLAYGNPTDIPIDVRQKRAAELTKYLDQH